MILNNKKISWNVTTPDYELYYRVIIIETAWYWPKNRNIDQWNGVEGPYISLHSYSHLTFDKKD